MREPTLAELQAQVADFVAERAWRDFHNPKNLAMSIAIEAAELMEHFQWLTAEQSEQQLHDPATRDAIAAELADILLYALSFAEATQIDLAAAILSKLAHNKQRFPVEGVRGTLGARPGGGHVGCPDDQKGEVD